MDIMLYVRLLLVHICVVNGFLIPDGIQKVTTSLGDIIGFTDRVKFGDQNLQVRKFLGIPYAEPPIGNLRLEKPVMKKRLQTPFTAHNYSAKCPQSGLDIDSMSEDCLCLNIFAPVVPSIPNANAPKPVMIWIYGGGFFQGLSDIYSGDVITALADVIVVTLNYRLGALGFFSTHDSMAKGNYGLWDQQLAIRWVYENIADFGGDTTNITIFGESAGSSSVIYQMLYPGNKGLFKRAIAESGTIAAWAVSHGNTNYESSIKFAQSLGCSDLSNISMCLQSKSEADVIAATLKFQIFNEVNRSWVPVFDDEFVLEKTPDILSELSDPSLRSKYSTYWDIDLMIGANNYDGVVYQDLFMAYLNNTTPSSISYNVSARQFGNIIVPRAVEAWLGETPTQLALDLTIDEYTAWNDPFNNTKRLQNMIDIVSDYALNAPTISTARAHLNDNSSTYVYQFSAAPPKRYVTIAPELDGPDAACHSDELPFVFGFTEPLRRYWKNFPENVISPNDYQLSREIITMWTNFAKSGNPNKPMKLARLNSENWPTYDVLGERYLEIASKRSEVKQRLRAEQVVFWNRLLPEMQAFAKTTPLSVKKQIQI